MENFLIKNRRSFMVLFGNLFFLCLIFISLDQFTQLSVSKFVNLNTIISLNIVFLFFWLFFFIKNNNKLKEKANYYLKLFFPISLIFTTTVSVNINNQILPFLYSQRLYLSVITVCLWFSIITLNKLDNQEKGNNINGALLLLILSLVTIIGFSLRLYKVDFLTPVTDEFYHLLAAKRYLIEGHYEYSRGSFVSFLTGLLFSITNNTSILVARIPSVIAGTIAIPLIYVWGKKINKAVGLLAAILLAFLPIAVGMSRYIREYIYFFFILIIYLIWLDGTLKKIFKKIKLKTTYFNLFVIFLTPAIYYFFVEDSSFVVLLYTLLLLLGVINIVYEKYNEIKKIKSRLVKILSTKWFLVVPMFLLISTLLYFLYSKVSWLFTFDAASLFNLPKLNYFDAIFNPSFHPWSVNLMWFSLSNFSVLLIFSFFLFSTPYFIKNKYYLFNLLAFFVLFLPFVFFANRYYAIRYVFYSLLFYTTIFSCSVYLIFKLSSIYKRKLTKTIYILIVSVFILNLVSPLTIIKNLKNERMGETDPSKELLSYDYPALFENLKNSGFKDGDFIITSDGMSNALSYYFNNYTFISNHSDYPLLRFQYKKNGDKLSPLTDVTTINEYYYISPYSRPCFDMVCNMPEEERIAKIIDSQRNGWIIIDRDRNKNWNNKGFPLHNFTIGKKNIFYINSIGGYRGFDIYNWGY